MKIYFFGVEDWEKLHIERKIREKGIQGDFAFFKEALDESTVDKAKDADIVSVFIYSKLSKEVIDKMPELKLIITRSSGYDHIDVKYAREKGIKVAYIPGYGNNTVAEYTFALILALARKFKPMIENITRGIFTREGMMGIDIMGKTIGIIGTGRIGSHVARIAHGFGMKILAYDRSKNEELIQKYGVKYIGLEELLSQSDIVTVHLPYNRATHFLINRFNIKLMKLDSILINTSRGEVVELEAIVEALKEGRLAGGVGLDTIETEITAEEALLKESAITTLKLKKAAEAKYLLSQENVIVSPHLAYYTKDASERILDTTVENIELFLKEGKLLTPVPES
ncbi:D-lactate dehydrogenase [Persephonella hydrogeniphila]|uniref:D-lactate dehydrogenase n=1 Tax=Persephonella hydrogeniphila TaxID=198703 RepID=A0A285NCP6_9AQUI|nr:NAD(P)-dependent oxidoreductase [Persephonella hydrogeniphila]SNZ07058.1 D-lactate dehydrogenase [Persephonella hydrogeniphila]